MRSVHRTNTGFSEVAQCSSLRLWFSFSFSCFWRLSAAVVVLWMLFPAQVFSQSPAIDSLRGRIAAKNFMLEPDTTRANIYNALAYECSEWSKYDETLLYCDSALCLASKAAHNVGKIEALSSIGIASVFTSRYEKGFKALFDALELSEASGDQVRSSGILHNISLGFLQVHQYHKALEYMRRAAVIAEAKLRQIVELEQKQAHKKSLVESRSIAFSLKSVSYKLGWIAYIHGMLGSLDSARLVMAQTRKIDAQRTFSSAIEKAYNDITVLATMAAAHSVNAQPDSTLRYGLEALKLLTIAPEPFALTITNKALGTAYFLRREYGLAEKFLLASAANAKEANAPQELADIYRALMSLERAQGQPAKALEYYDLSKALQDTLFNAQRLTAIIENESSRTTELVRQAAARERELQTLWRNVLLVGIGLLLVLMLLVVNRYRLKRRNEEALKELNTRLEHTNEELIALNREKDELLGIVAHDLKNPIAGIRSVTKLLQQFGDRIPPERLQSSSAMIHQATESMLSLINNLLNVNAIDQGVKRFAAQELYFPALVEEIVAEYEIRAAEKSITIHLDLPSEPDGEPSADYVVESDPVACRQIIDNLISNAVKYSPHGKHVWVSVSNTKSGGDLSRKAVLMRVADEGVGISPDEEKKLFGKFMRLSTQPTGGEQQTGLGLSIVKRLAHAMGGDVRYDRDSKASIGAVFELFIPAKSSVENSINVFEQNSANAS
jgi:signal transduction histidine kinase